MSVAVRAFAGYWLGRVVALAVLIVVGLLIAGAHAHRSISPADREAEADRQQAVLVLDAEEAVREASYAATPGPPYPTASFRP